MKKEAKTYHFFFKQPKVFLGDLYKSVKMNLQEPQQIEMYSYPKNTLMTYANYFRMALFSENESKIKLLFNFTCNILL